MKNHSGIWQMVLFSNEFVRATLFYILLPLIFIHKFNLTIEWVGLCTSCQFAADAITKVFFGVAASRGYSHWMIRGGSAVSSASVLGFQFFHRPYLILLFSIFFGIGAASIWPAALSHFSHNNAEKQGESLAKAFTPWMAGTGVGMFLPNVLIHRHQMYIYFLILIAASTVFLGSLLLKPAGHENTPSYRREILFILILFRKMKLFLVPMVIQTMVIGMIAPFLALFAVKSLHLHPSQYAILLVSIGSITVLLLIPFGKVSDRIGRLPLLSFAFLIASFGILSLSECHNWKQALFAAILFSASYGAVFPAWNALFINSVPSWLHARALGLFTAIEDSGTMLGPFLGALSWKYIGPPGPFLLAGTFMLVLAIYFLVWWRGHTTKSSV